VFVADVSGIEVLATGERKLIEYPPRCGARTLSVNP